MGRKPKILAEDILDPPLSVNFDKFVGLKASLYYNNHALQFQLGNVLFEVIEDENDGYRSAMREVVVISKDKSRIVGEYLAGVTIKLLRNNDFDGYLLVDDSDGHTWLQFGTSCWNDYYPCFTFEFAPKPPKPAIEDIIKNKLF